MLFSISQAVYLHGCACTPTIFACSQCRLESHSLFKKVKRARYLILLVGQVYKILWLDLLTSNWFIRFLFSFLLFSVYVFIFFQLFLCIWPSFCVSILYTRFHGSVWYSRFLFFSYFFFTVIYIFCIYDEVSDCDFSENYLAIFWYQLFIMHLAGYIYIYLFLLMLTSVDTLKKETVWQMQTFRFDAIMHMYSALKWARKWIQIHRAFE